MKSYLFVNAREKMSFEKNIPELPEMHLFMQKCIFQVWFLKIFKHAKRGLRLMLLELALMLTNAPLELTTVMKMQLVSIGRFKMSVLRTGNTW